MEIGIIKEITQYGCSICDTLYKTGKEAEKCFEECTVVTKFPRRFPMYLHGSKEENADYMDEYKLNPTENADFNDNFLHSLSEVEFLVEVDKEGNTKIIEVDGRKLEEKKE